ncbi:hypothetical protein PTTG_26550 [Puccinia triticina 1-1 BBBD Race 1]|uniref:Uncharacterized protein n=1 Tax=Puccinia triticina (isolate 1-1 / race 1 (BBBD)) TaxID=630390 RepID=A0A180GTG7_PUCT1|nr:hypothetical protein PTTG_26550 [Puccinia triticina 1-1 BBBD Race 1]
MSDPRPLPQPSASQKQKSSSSVWSGRSITELEGQDLINAVTASIENTPNRLAQIFGAHNDIPESVAQQNPLATSSLHPSSPGDVTVINQRIPGAWQQAQPATPGYCYYPALPNLPITDNNPENIPLSDQHYAPLPRSTFRNPLFPPPASPPPPPPPSFASPIESSNSDLSSCNITVPPSPPSPHHPPPTSFVMDQPPHLSAARRAADLAEAKAQLEESKIVGQAIQAATSKIPDEVVLAADGANFEAWSRELGEKGGIHLNDKEFLVKANVNSVLEKIGQAIFLAMIHDSLWSDVHDSPTCHGMYNMVFKKFKSSSTNPTSAGIASKLKDLAKEWKNLKIELTTDVFMGFILQSSIGRDSALGQDFDRRVELELQSTADNATPTFDKLVQLLAACKLQDDHTRPSSKLVPSDRHSPALLQASSDLPLLIKRLSWRIFRRLNGRKHSSSTT